MTRIEFLKRLVVIAIIGARGTKGTFCYELIRLMDDLNLK